MLWKVLKGEKCGIIFTQDSRQYGGLEGPVAVANFQFHIL